MLWEHLIPTKYVFFVNGSLDHCISNNYGSALNTSNGINVASELNNESYAFDRLISRVEIWNRDWTAAAEIEANVQQSFQTSLSNPNLVAYYP